MSLNVDRRGILKGLGAALLGLTGAGAAGAAAAQPLKGELLPRESDLPDWVSHDAARFLSEWDGAVFAITKNGIVVERPGEKPIALWAPASMRERSESASRESASRESASRESDGSDDLRRASDLGRTAQELRRRAKGLVEMGTEDQFERAMRGMDAHPKGPLGSQGTWFPQHARED
jgi:hypothetical protein